jgi:hypothetical protein
LFGAQTLPIGRRVRVWLNDVEAQVSVQRQLGPGDRIRNVDRLVVRGHEQNRQIWMCCHEGFKRRQSPIHLGLGRGHVGRVQIGPEQVRQLSRARNVCQRIPGA